MPVPREVGERAEQAEWPSGDYSAHGPAFVEALRVKKFHGVGPATSAKMEKLEILTGADLGAKPLAFLRQYFGKPGSRYYSIACGVDGRPVIPDRTRKSIGAEDTFQTDIFSFESAASKVPSLVDKVWGHCEVKDCAAES